MNCDITTHILRGCKNLQGGVNKLYLFPYVKYSRSQITVVGQELTNFPSTIIYDWDSIVTNYSENTSIEGGGIAWGQNFTIQIPKTIVSSEVFKLVKKDYRAIYIDRIGNIRILGLYNGLEAQINNETGQNKPDFNGYKVTFTGKEDNQAYFIKDLGAAGFDIYTIYNFIFDNGLDNFVMDNETDNFIMDNSN
ncbi:MAG: hypothetical protein KUG64_10330 [Cycloclasticus sp.]|nr:hypothetical protein [Cycloclasticus sp.]